MSDNDCTSHDLGDDSQVAALLRAADESAVEALRATLDIEGRLATVLARADAERASVATVFGVDVSAVLASWSVDLTRTAVRGVGPGQRIVRAVTDPEFFQAVMGRQRSGLEPWPDLCLEFAEDAFSLVAVLSLPSSPARGVRVAVMTQLGGRTAGETFVVAADTESVDRDDSWPVDLSATLRLAPEASDALGETVVSLKAVRVDGYC
ncbi:hypothetical protein [Streptomyces ossamyceticus]|uniref:hypothetical protein n=1 Tax=Streptomyces ossamyceticus TaxID=249581 RepID=UPI0006E3D3BD|nr:hypothetical protein [Streptomyces ossamyceticus]